jgi:hypothetical protein
MSTSLRQLARPAVELSVLFQIILTPPVSFVSSAICPAVISRSSSARNDVASASLVDSNSFLAARAALHCFVGLLREGVGLEDLFALSSSLFFGDTRGFCGEYVSFHSLTMAWDQNSSRSSWNGALGMIGSFDGD